LLHGGDDYLVLHNVACIYAALSQTNSAQATAYQDVSIALLRRALKLWINRLLIRHLKAHAEQRRVKWSVVREADASPPESRDWQNLLRLVGEAMPVAETELRAGSGPLLLTYPGLLARYDQVGWLNRLATWAGKVGDPPALWVLVAGDGMSARPVLDGKAIPVLDSSQYAHVPESWIRNEHRAGL
jgi:hypothetical protein